jgi:hypothetical protein
MELSIRLAGVLKDAEAAVGELPAGERRSERLQWLERQLANIVAQLNAFMADLDSGWSIYDLGFCGDEEFEEIVDDFGRQIANLKGLIQVAMLVER